GVLAAAAGSPAGVDAALQAELDVAQAEDRHRAGTTTAPRALLVADRSPRGRLGRRRHAAVAAATAAGAGARRAELAPDDLDALDHRSPEVGVGRRVAEGRRTGKPPA